jgi:hypothetical protein
MAAMLPEARLVVQFRNPVERAYSDYKMLFRRGTVRGLPQDYLVSPDNPQPRFLNDGLYASHLERWLEHYRPEQIYAFLYDDVKSNPQATIEAISRHVGVAPLFDEEQSRKRANDGSERFLPLSLRKALSPFKNTVKPLRGTRWFEATRSMFASEIPYPPLPRDVNLRMRDFYAEDVARLGRMLGRDLSVWLEDPSEKVDTDVFCSQTMVA